MAENFTEALCSGRALLSDGAIGTLLYEKGIHTNRCFEEVNVAQPDLVREIHREYVKAGADIISTNTFGANSIKLGKFGLESKLAQINRQGVKLARDESRGSAFVAAVIGPSSCGLDDSFAVFEEQAGALIGAEPDLILLETFRSIEEIKSAVSAIRSVSKKIPLVVQASFGGDDRLEDGSTAQEFVKIVSRLPVSAVGANCSLGARHLLGIAEQMVEASDMPIIIQPGAGRPEILDDRAFAMMTPEYLMTYAKRYLRIGVKIVGGCCGTRPAHISTVRGAILALSPSRVEVKDKNLPDEISYFAETPTAEKSDFARKLSEGIFVRSVELLPPKGADPAKSIESARKLKSAGIDCINIPDGPRAMARMNPSALAQIFREQVDIDPIIHYTCRDKNLLGMQAEILGASATGLHDILVITGDPPKLGNYPNATAVYDVDAIGLVKMIKNLNRGVDIVGSPIKGQTSIHIGVGANPGAMNLDEEIRRFEQKVESGAEFCMTQPVFKKELLINFLERIKNFRIPVLVGILPLVSSRSAEFLHNEVPGMQVPLDIRQSLRHAGESAKDVGIAIARKAYEETKSEVEGVYVMAPVGGAKTALAVLDL